MAASDREKDRAPPFQHTRPSGFTLSFKNAVPVFGLMFLIATTLLVWNAVERRNERRHELDAAGASLVQLLAATDPESWSSTRGTLLDTAERTVQFAEQYGDYLELAYGIVVDESRIPRRIESMSDTLKRQQEVLRQEFESQRQTNERRLEPLLEVPRVLDAYIVEASGPRMVIRARSENPAFRTENPEGRALVAASAVRVRQGELDGLGAARHYSRAIHDAEGNTTHEAHLFLSDTGLGHVVDGALVTRLGIALVLCAIATAACYFITRFLTGPILTLVHDVDTVAAGDLGHRTHVNTDDEIGLLARTMESMVRRIDRARTRENEQMATRIHQKMMPDEVPFIRGYPVELLNKQTPAIDGTYHDFLYFPSQFGFVIAQGSRSGIAAALNVLMAGTSLRAESRHSMDPAALLCRVNATLYENLHSEMDVRMVLGILDPGSHRLRIASAGGLPVLRFEASQQRCSPVALDGLPLGQDPGGSFDLSLKTMEVELAPGDSVLLTNGGLVSLRNEGGETLGVERLCEMVRASGAGQSSAKLVAGLRDDLNGFLGDAKVKHDVVTVLISREAGDEEDAVVESMAADVTA